MVGEIETKVPLIELVHRTKYGPVPFVGVTTAVPLQTLQLPDPVIAAESAAAG